ncbi:DinB superfamily protein [Pedobacter gandavensis]|uniref:DinB superfamily protein n=1 Tax=Pedobacter gandavensis TaxID=2679963 RepID=UPI00292CB3BB|nr:DinB superfamily protein [Pedobacter gandavensis]
MTKQDYIHIYERDLQRLISEIEAYPQSQQMWLTATGITNTAGHLAQHLIGNLRTFVCAPMGGFPYERDREAEFKAVRFTDEALLKELYALKADVQTSIERVEDLNAAYPVQIKEVYEGQTNDFMLCHLLAHLAYHTGQINYHRRLLTSPVTPVQK